MIYLSKKKNKKLNSYGTTGKELDWLKSYLSGRTQAVDINSTLSNFKNIEIGLPQGSILGPLLFIIFVIIFIMVANVQCT